MANKKRLEDNKNVPMDDFEDWDYGDWDVESEEGDSRSPAKPYRTEIKKAFKDHLSSSTNIRTYVGKVLPKQYGELFDDYTNAREQIESAIDEARSNLKQPLNQLSKYLEKKVPDRFKRTKNWLGKLKDATDSGPTYTKESLEEIRNKSTTTEIQNLFAQMQEENISLKEEDREIEKDRFTKNFAKLHSQENLLGILAKGSEYHRTYLQNLEIPYRKKSLELQYRTVHTLQDILKLQTEFRKDSFQLMEKIRVNTGLSEIQKLRLSEHYKQDMRNRFVSGSLSFARDTLNLNSPNSPVGQMLTNFKRNLKEAVDAFTMAAGAAEMADSMDMDDFEEKTEVQKKAEKLGSFLKSGLDTAGPWVVDKYKEKFGKKHFNKLSFKQKRALARVRKGAHHIDSIRHNPMGPLQELQRKLEDMSYESSILKSVGGEIGAGLLEMLTTGGNPSTSKSLTQMSSAQLREASQFDHYSRKSLTEVIPGFLARILQEQQIQRTGDTSIKRLIYNYQSGLFETSKKVADRLDAAALKPSKGFQRHVKNLELPLQGAQLSEEARKAFIQSMALKKKTGSVFTLDDLAKESFYTGTPAQPYAKELAQAIQKNSFGKNRKNITTSRFLKSLTSFDSQSEGVREQLQFLMDSGQSDFLREQGWVNDDASEYNLQRVINGILGHADGYKKVHDELVPNGFRDGSSRAVLKEAMDQPQRAIITQATPIHEETTNYRKQHLSLLESLQSVLTQHKEGNHKDLMTLKESMEKGFAKAVTNINLVRVRKNYQQQSPNIDVEALLQAAREKAGQAVETVSEKFQEAKEYTQEQMQTAEQRLRDQEYQVILGKIAAGVKLTDEEKAFFKEMAKEKALNKANEIKEKSIDLTNKTKSKLRIFSGWSKKKLSQTKEWWDKPSGVADFFSNLVGQSSYLGARTFQRFLEDGIPTLGDVYIYGIRDAVITRSMFQEGNLVDAEGKVIKTLQDLASAVGDIKDQLGNVVITQEQLKNSYLRADGKIIVKEWFNKLTRAGKFSRHWMTKGAKLLYSKGLSAVLTSFQIGKTIRKGVTDLILPPKDLYVKGENQPRLYAFKMEKGLYYNEDGSQIFRPTDIRGSVVDADGNILYDIRKEKEPLVDVEGRPVQSLSSLVIGHIRKNFQRTHKLFKTVTEKTFNTLKSFGRGTKRFLTHGFTGLMTSPNIPGYDLDPKLDPTTQTNTLLYQIREILDQRLGGGSSGSFSSEETNKEPTNINEPPEMPQANEAASSSNTLGKLWNLSKNTFGSATSALGGIMTRGRGWFGRRSQETATDNSEESTREEDLQDLQNLKEEQQKTTKRLERRLQAKERLSRIKKVTKDRTGKPFREGSAEERKANWVNINEPTKTLDDVQMPEAMVRKNTIDAIIDMASKIASGFKSSIERMSDWMDFGGDDGPDRKKRSKSRIPKSPKGGKKPGMIRRGLGKLYDTGKGLLGWGWGKGKKVAGKVKTSPGRFAKIGKAAGWLGRTGAAIAGGLLKAGKFGVTKILPRVAGFALGGPVGWVVTGITTYSMIKGLFKEKDSSNQELFLIRMSEYGAPYEDSSTHQMFRQIEDIASKAVTITQEKASLNRDDVDFEEIAHITGLAGNTEQIPRFLTWFDKRFTPVFLKWYSTKHLLGKKNFSELYDLDTKGKLKILDATSNATGWDEMTNPLGFGDLKISSKEIKLGRDAYRDKLNRELKGKQDKGIKDLSDYTKQQSIQEYKDIVTGKKTVYDKDGNAITSYTMRQIAAAQILHEKGRNFKVVAFEADNVRHLTSDPITELQSIRYRLYGYRTMNFQSTLECRAVEELLQKDITTQPNGKALYRGDLSDVFRKAAPVFGILPEDRRAEMYFTNWLNKRVLPVYTAFIGSAQFHTGTLDDKLIASKASAIRIFAIAQSMVSANVMRVMAAPYVNFELNGNIYEMNQLLETLKQKANQEEVKEDIKKPSVLKTEIKPSDVPQKHSDLSQTPTKQEAAQALNTQSPVQEASGVMKVSYKPNRVSSYQAIPDFDAPVKQESEAEPPTVSTANTPEGTKDVSSQMPSAAIPAAAGELKDGTSGMQFIKTNKSRNHIEGLHPMVKKLFLGMVQEYGEITGKKIQVNRGFVTFQEQAEEKRRNPRKAASPGHSLHEFGMAIDINTVDANALEKLGLMKKYGFTRPIGGETWHIEPSGIQHDPHGLKKKPQEATSAIASSPGTGGGGIGQTKNAARLGSRNTQAALKTRSASGNKVQPEQIAKESTSVHGKGGFAAQIKDQVKNNSILTEAKGDAKSLYSSLSVQGKDKDAMKALVDQAAAGVGVHPDAAKTTVAVESGFRSAVGNSKSSAQGLYQFTSKTWDGMMDKYAKAYGIPIGTSPRDPKANAIMGALFMKENLQLAQKRNQGSTMQTAYLYHFAGAPDANKILSAADNAILANVVPSAARSNKEMFYKKDGTPRTKQEFMEYVNRKIRNAANGFGIDTAFMDDGQEPTVMKAATQVVQPPTRREPSPVVSPREDFGRAVMTQSIPAPSRVTPVISQAEQEVSRILRDNNKILTDQLSVQKEIKQAVDAVKASIEQTLVEAIGKIQTNPPTTTTPEAPRSRRALEEVTKPAYRTT